MNLKINDKVRIKSSIEIGQVHDYITMLPSMKRLANNKTIGTVKAVETRDRPYLIDFGQDIRYYLPTSVLEPVGYNNNIDINVIELFEFVQNEFANRLFVYAMRIYLKDGYQPMADLILTKNGKPDLNKIVTIPYDDVAAREKFVINAYTLVYDERINQPWFKL